MVSRWQEEISYNAVLLYFDEIDESTLDTKLESKVKFSKKNITKPFKYAIKSIRFSLRIYEAEDISLHAFPVE